MACITSGDGGGPAVKVYNADGSTRFVISGHEMGQGIRTALAAAGSPKP